jgi:hypothetical protein
MGEYVTMCVSVCESVTGLLLSVSACKCEVYVRY